jgi:hypothetical protein
MAWQFTSAVVAKGRCPADAELSDDWCRVKRHFRAYWGRSHCQRYREKKWREEAAINLLTNHDIALTQAAAIRRRSEDCARRLHQPGQTEQRDRLLAIAAVANEREQWWLKAVQDPFVTN